MIPGFPLGGVLVFDGLDGAGGDAGHAVGAIAVPPGIPACHGDVLQRAGGGAFSAVDAG